MILHPGILALLIGSGIVLVMLLVAGWTGLRIIRRWDADSTSEAQLRMERRTYLVSTLSAYALGFEVVSLFLFVFTVDDIHGLFVGAMCATGSLNAHSGGWWVLLVKLLIVVAAPVWMAFNRLDQRAGDFPIVRAKYVGLLALVPLVIADLVLELHYFGGLEPKVITSCCGALFSDASHSVAGEMAGLPVPEMMWLFYVTLAAFVLEAAIGLWRGWAAPRAALSVLAPVLLVVSLAAIVSFVSLYIYELPTHHCPFDVFQGGYSYVGYPLYASLFAAVYYGLLPGLSLPLRRIPSLQGMVLAADRRWLGRSMVSVVLFTAMASWPIVFGGLSLMGY